MEPLALLLAALAVVLAVPVPKLLREAHFRARSPWAAMLLWQAIALAGGLSIVGAPLVFGLSPFGESLPEALQNAFWAVVHENYDVLADHQVHAWHIFALCLGVLLAGHLLLTLTRTYVRVLSARRRHRQLVELLSTPLTPSADHAALGLNEAQVIESDALLAYCLPGRTNARSVTVLSRGLLDSLQPEELAAVIAHENTHLAQRHHLLSVAFEAWYKALPWLPTTRYGREAVLELTEMLADDGALAEYSRHDLLRALALTSPASEVAPEKPDDVVGGHTSQIAGVRLQRLLVPPVPLGRASTTAIVAVSAALMAVPTVLLLTS